MIGISISTAVRLFNKPCIITKNRPLGLISGKTLDKLLGAIFYYYNDLRKTVYVFAIAIKSS